MNNMLIKGAAILTMRDEQPFAGDILIEEDRIARIGPDIGEAGVDEVIPAAGMAAMPGLVNAHQHTPMCLLRGFSDDLKLMDWLKRKMLPAEARMTPEDIYWGAKLAMAEMIRSGTTAFADMYIHMNEITAAVEETGMRASLTRGLVFTEDDGRRRMAEALDLIRRWHGKADGRITTMLGPHAPYTVPPERWREVIRIAEQENLPIHTHLAETVEEVAIIRERYGMTPTEYLVHAGLFERTHVLLAHAVHLNRRDVGRLRGMRGGVAHNPVSNLKLGCGITRRCRTWPRRESRSGSARTARAARRPSTCSRRSGPPPGCRSWTMAIPRRFRPWRRCGWPPSEARSCSASRMRSERWKPARRRTSF